MFKITYDNTNNKTHLFHNSFEILRLDGNISIEDMVERLKGYIHSALTEIPKEIAFWTNGNDERKVEIVPILEEELATANLTMEDIETFQKS